jgi:hypothetical protein
MSPRAQRIVLATLLAAALMLAADPPPARGAPGTLDRLVASLDLGLGEAMRGEQPARIDLALWVGQGAGASQGLVKEVRDLLVSRLNRRGFRRVEVVSAGAGAEARRRHCRRSGFERLLDLELLVVEGYLHLKGGLKATDRQLWRDTVRPLRGVRNHLHARIRVDAEVRAYTGRVTSGALRFVTRAFPLPKLRRVLALRIGDLDGDGRSELVALRPGWLEVLRYRGEQKGFEHLARTRLVPPSAHLRPRRPVGAMVVKDLDRDGKVEVLVRSSEMKQGAVFRLKGRDLQRGQDLSGYPLDVDTGQPGPALVCQDVAGKDFFDLATLPAPLAAALPQELLKAGAGHGGFYTLKRAAIAKRGQGPVRYTGLVDGGGQLRVFATGSPPGQLAHFPSVGIAFDMADLDDDGVLEVVTTSNDNLGEKDLITISSVRVGGTPRLVWRSAELQGAVMTLTHGDIDGDGKLEVVGALENTRGDRGAAALLVLK